MSDSLNLTPDEIERALIAIKALPIAEQAELADALEHARREQHLQKCRDHFLDFVREVWPAFVCGPHHLKMAEQFELMAAGRQKRITISISPRSGKSELTSYLLPAWLLGKFPDKKILQVSHISELATGFGRRVRNLVSEPIYQEIFPNVSLKADNKAAGRWETNRGGTYYAAGVGSSLSGFGADFCVAPDTLVTTEYGDRRIEDVVSGDDRFVFAFDHESDQPVMKSILARGGRRSARMVRITHSKGYLDCTPDHPIWVIGRGYVDAETVRNGEKLLSADSLRMVRNGVQPCTETEVLEVSEICVPDGGAQVFNITVEGCNNYFSGYILSHNCVIDDPHADKDAPLAAYDKSIFDKVYSWYIAGPRQRLQPQGNILVVQTRWGDRDLIGRLLDDQKTKGADRWTSIIFPAIITNPDGSERSYWPAFWPIEELQATRAAITASGSAWHWNAQYLQAPTAVEGAIIKPDWWRIWPKEFPPKCEFIIQAWDTANRATQRSDYTVCTTWGVFTPQDSVHPHIIMLDLFRDKLEFPALKRKALELYRYHAPDSCVIEGKNSGDSLIFELRRMGLFVEDFTPTRGDGDKIARVNAITDIFASGCVWIMDKEFTSTVMDESQAFPLGAHDDIVDTIAMALSRYRRGNFLHLELDEEEDELNYMEKADYY